MRIRNQTRDFVFLIRHYLFVEKMRKPCIGQRKLCRYPLLRRLGSHPGQHIAAAHWRGLRQQFTQVGECVSRVADGVGKGHAFALAYLNRAASGEEIV